MIVRLSPSQTPVRRLARLLAWTARLLIWMLLMAGIAWAFGALWFDFPWHGLRHAAAVLFALAALAMLMMTRKRAWLGRVEAAAWVGLVAVWWTSLKPSLDRDWQPEVARLPWAEIEGDKITLHNVRNFDHRRATDPEQAWQTRVLHLSQITGVDIFINYWGSPWMAHPIISFQVAGEKPVCFSIETRKEKGEAYSALGGLYRQFELYYVVADERDVVRLRAAIRPGETSYLYRTHMSPERARGRFMDYVDTINALHQQPRWYHAITSNCTTAIRGQRQAEDRLPWDWRLIVNGKGDELLYDRKLIADDGLPFVHLRARALINEAAAQADESPDFSSAIRQNRPGFSSTP